MQVEDVSWVLPVIHPADDDLCRSALSGINDPRLLDAVEGGATRAISVRRGLEHLCRHAPDHVLVHDAARPFVTRAIISDVIAALDMHEGACAALPVVDALWRSEGLVAQQSVPRDGLWRAQTPQGFRFGSILDAHRMHDGAGADDVAVAREAGITVQLVPGSEQNYKITTQADLERARSDICR